MDNGIHFISGLPRSGSTLLSAMLRQNPRFHAGMSGPVSSIYLNLMGELSGRNEFVVFIDDEQRRDVLAAVFDAYYKKIHPTKVVFDTSRLWCAKAPSLLQIFPEAKIICCVRQVSWVIDSVERLLRKNPFQLSKMFGFDIGGTVYSRAEAMTGPGGMIGNAMNGLREAFYSELSNRLILVQYQSLTRRPGKTLAEIYEFIGEKRFEHDFENVEYDAEDFDVRLGTPGLHTVKTKVEYVERETILPPDLFEKHINTAWWGEPANNKNKVKIV